MVLEKTLESPYTARRSIQSILKKINLEYSLARLMLKLKLQYFSHLRQRADSLEKTLRWERLRAGGEGGSRGWDGWMASLTQWTWVWANSRRWWRTREAWRAAVHGVTKIWTWLNDWSTTTIIYRNTIGFFTLTLYPVTLLNLRIFEAFPFVLPSFLGFSISISSHSGSPKLWSLNSSAQDWCFLLEFYMQWQRIDSTQEGKTG